MINIYDYLIYYYLLGTQKTNNIYNSIIIKIFGFNEIKMVNSQQKNIKNIIPRYILYSLITFIINSCDNLKNKIVTVRNKFDISADKVQITKINEIGEKTMILNDNNNKITFNDIQTQIYNAQIDDKMLNCIILTFSLVNSNTDKICLKKFITKYKDIEEIYDQTLENILTFNNIDWNNNSHLIIKIVKNKKIMTFDIPFQNIKNKHINYLIELGFVDK